MNRVVITGLGVISPIGSGKHRFWEALLAGTCGIAPVTSVDASKLSVHLGAEVRDFDPASYLRKRSPEAVGRTSQFAVAAARMALEDASLSDEAPLLRTAGVCLGTTSGEAWVVERYNDLRCAAGLDAIPGEMFHKYPSNVIPSNIAIELGLHGPCMMIPTACAAGNYAIGYAFDTIRDNRAELMLAGGADAFSRITYYGFARLGAIAPKRCQPFDKNRKGMVPGEGAAVLILESLEHARARGANIYAEVRGYGISCDAHHMTAAHPLGDGAVRAMARAMKDSDVSPADVDYISAHGTGTPTNDRVEAIALHTLFGARARQLPMSSVKSMLGHSMGAASAIEGVVCALAIATGLVPPTINFEEPDPDCEVDCVPNHAREVRPGVVLNNAYAFGGNNACVCFSKYQG
jgi:3-oxoacyl-[acyl-carrier-protein] synthase II